jgi:hypothetical protein
MFLGNYSISHRTHSTEESEGSNDIKKHPPALPPKRDKLFKGGICSLITLS